MSIPGQNPGTYALVLRIDRISTLRIGKLGGVVFPAGDYVYVGSARGPGGLRARLAHHCQFAEKPHWHVDWLRQRGRIAGIGWVESQQPLECAWVRLLVGLQGTAIPSPGFGASDCGQGCPAHLIFFGTMVEKFGWRQSIEEIFTRLHISFAHRRFYCCPGSTDQGNRTPEPGDW